MVDELLDAQQVTGENPVCVIDKATRKINMHEACKLFGVEHDKRVERIKFECAKEVGDENLDLTQCSVYIAYENAGAEPGLYEVKDIIAEGDIVHFSWLLDEDVTKYKGSVTFIIYACKVNAGEREQAWNTIPAQGDVEKGLKIPARVEKASPAIIESLLVRVAALEKSGTGGTVTKEQIKQAVAEYLEENPEPVQDTFAGYDRFYNSIARLRVNPDIPLDIATYDGSGQLTHPCVRYFPEGFAGHKFWMTASPYPDSALDLENPCVWYSDDGIHWSADGIPNPLDLPLTVNGAQASMNSDPHLLVRPDGVMEVWWRTNYWENSGEGLYTVVYRRTSTDGVNWTAKEELHRMLTNSADGIVCPVALYEDGVYKIWAVSDQECLRYYESATGAAWRHIRDIDVSNPDYPEYKVWHFDINRTAKGYEFVGCYNIPGDYTSHKYLYYAVSQDNITYSKRVMILTRGETGRFDERLVYRPTIVRMADRVRIYYGANNADNVWSIGLIEAPSAYLFNAVLISGARVGAIESGQEWLDGRVTALEAQGGGGDSRPADEGVTVVRSFDESPWLPGYWDPSNDGELTLYSNMHRTQLVELASLTVDGELPVITATSSVVSWPLVRFNYFDGNLRWIGFDVGATTDPSAGTQEPTRLTWPAGAVYVAISANTADKGAVTVSGVPEGGDSAGADHVIAVETLASGTVTAGTADAFETGVTMGMIRKYRLFLVAIGGVSNQNLNNWYMWIGGKSILRVNVVRGQQILYEFLDNAKTVMLAHSGASGNVGAPAGFLGGSNSYGQFAPGGYACCIYDMADVPDDEPVIIQPNGADTIDVNWVIMGVTK